MKENAFARELRAVHGLELGGYGDTYYSPVGAPYDTLKGFGGEDEAAEAFSAYVTRRRGKIWWRTVPEIVSGSRDKTFYMRLKLVEQKT